MSIRPIKRIVQSQPTIEGAGVKLRRAFGFGDTAESDPFLLLDDFRNDRPADYLAGFPWHPHRGIETITYVLGRQRGPRRQSGKSRHARRRRRAMDDCGQRHHASGDAAGRRAGPHARIPAVGQPALVAQDDGAALSGHRVATIPEVTDDDGTHVRVVCGDFWGKNGPVDGVAADPRYLDMFVPPGKRKTLWSRLERHAFAYVFEGDGTFRDASQPLGVLTEKQVDGDEILVREQVGDRSLVLFDRGDEIIVQAGDNGIRFLLVSGKPIEEPVAWYGPIVMNTQAELQQAVSDLRSGTFIRA